MGWGDRYGAFVQAVTLGKYQLLKKIAVGGMAEIYAAKTAGPSGIEKVLVVKKNPTARVEPRVVLHAPTRRASRPPSLNIVQMFDIPADEGGYYFSMEYLHGEDLRSLMKAVRGRGEAPPVSKTEPEPVDGQEQDGHGQARAAGNRSVTTERSVLQRRVRNPSIL